MNNADKEIIDILKELVRKKQPNEWIDPDDQLRESILKWLFAMCMFLISVVIIHKIMGIEPEEIIGLATASLISVFFGLLFMYLNAKSQNPSLILYGLTYISMMIPLWI